MSTLEVVAEVYAEALHSHMRAVGISLRPEALAEEGIEFARTLLLRLEEIARSSDDDVGSTDENSEDHIIVERLRNDLTLGPARRFFAHTPH